jgi:hypothetical protein
LKAIIDERPSAVPVGVGNNSSGYDVSILAPSGNTSEFDWSDPGLGLHGDGDGDHGDGNGEGEGEGEGKDNSDDDGSDSEGSDDSEGGNSDIEDAPVAKQVPSKTLKTLTTTKRKATAVEAPETKTPKTSARAGKLTPAATTASQQAAKKPKTGIEKISAITAKEEEMTQKVLELKKLRMKGENDKVLVKIKAKADVKMQRMKLRAELTQKKMDNEFQLQMARIGHTRMHSTVAASSSGYSDTRSESVAPSTYSISEMPRSSLDPSLEFFGLELGYDFYRHSELDNN